MYTIHYIDYTVYYNLQYSKVQRCPTPMVPAAKMLQKIFCQHMTLSSLPTTSKDTIWD